jgi:uncharacterized protein (TIGR02145 family)
MFFRNLILTCLVLFTVSAKSQVNSYDQLPTNLKNGLVAYYPFNNNYQDISGNAYDGIAQGGSVPFIADRFGNSSSAVQLGGGYITTSTSVFNFQYEQSFTVSIWFTKESAGDGGRLLSTECPEGNFRIAAYNGGGYVIAFGDYIVDTVTINEWNHLVYTYDNRNEKIYINGNLKYTNYDPVTEGLNYCAPLTIGAKASAAFDRWLGKADDLAVYNRALTNAEVTQLYTVSSTGVIDSGITCSNVVFNPFQDTLTNTLDSVELDAGSGFANYLWNTGVTTQKIIVNESGLYHVSVTNNLNCTYTDSVLVSFVNLSISASDTVICSNQEVQLTGSFVGIEANSGLNNNLKWSKLIDGSQFVGAEVNFQHSIFDPYTSKLYSILKSNTVNRYYQFDLNTNQVTSLPSLNAPGELYAPAFDFTNNRIIATRSGRDAVYSLPLEGGSWTSIGTGGFDAESYGGAPFWNPVTSRFGYFGGYGFFAVKNWVWENNGSNGWLNVYANNSNCEPAKRNTQIARNADGKKLYFFSGQGSCDGNQFASSCSNSQPWGTDVGVYCWLKDLWELDLSTYAFTNLLPVNNASILKEGSFAYDFDLGYFYNIGGYVPSPTWNPNIGSQVNFTNEVYRYKPGANSGFESINVGGIPPPETLLNQYAGRTYYDSKYKRIIWARNDGVWALSQDTSIKSIKYLWSTGDTTRSINVTPTQTTKYYLTVSDGIVSYQDSVTIKISEPLDFNPFSDTTSVYGTSVELNAGNSYSNYLWNNNTTSSSITATTSGWYSVTVTNGNGCSASDSTYLSIINVKIIQPDTTICKGQSITLTTSTSNTFKQLWSNIYSNSNGYFREAIIDSGSLVVSGGYWPTWPSGTTDQLITKISADGNLLWQNVRSPGGDHDAFHSVQMMDNGNYLFFGQQNAQGTSYFDGFWAIYNKQGIEQSYGFFPVAGSTSGTDVQKLPNGNYVFTGPANGQWVALTDSNLVQLKYMTFPMGTWTGSYISVDHNNSKIYVVASADNYFKLWQFDFDLNLLNSFVYNFTGLVAINDIECKNGTVHLAGYEEVSGVRYGRVFMIDGTGNIVKTLSPSLSSEFTALSSTTAGFLLARNNLSSNVSVSTSLEYYLDDLTLRDSIMLGQSPFYVSDMIQDNGSLYLTGVQGPVWIGLPRVDKYTFNSNVYNRVWSNGSQADSIVVSPLTTTKYYVTFSDGTISVQDSVTISVQTNDQVNILPDSLIFSTSSLELDASANYISYLWNTGSNSQKTTVGESGRYIVKVEDANKCVYSDTVFVNIVNLGLSINDTTISAGSTLGVAVQQNNPIIKPGEGVYDQSGNYYESVIINGTEWMSSNLKTTKYSNGDSITNISSFSPFSSDFINYNLPGYSIYDNDQNNLLKFGALYNLFAVYDERGLCPTGWHLPSASEWNKLLKLSDPLLDTTTLVILKGTPGKRLKAIDSNLWVPSNNGATDQFGLSITPGGRRGYNGEYISKGESALLWSSSYQGGQGSNYLIAIVNTAEGDGSLINSYGQLYSYDPKDANSIRCVKDTSSYDEIIYNWSNGDSTSSINIYPFTSQTLTSIVTVGNITDTLEVRINVNAKTYSLEKQSVKLSDFPISWNGLEILDQGTYKYATQNSLGSDSTAILEIGLLPNIAYDSIYRFTLNQPIDTISPVSLGSKVIGRYGLVTTVAGTGQIGSTNGAPGSSEFNFPTDVEVDINGNVYVTDRNNHKIRKITSNGIVTTLAGLPTNGNGFADGTGDAAAFSLPTGLAIDSSGNILVADRSSNRIRKITPEGVVSTIAGEGNFGTDDGYNTSAKFTYPYDITVDPLGNIWVTDEFNHLIRKIDKSGYVSTIAGTGVYGSQDGSGTSASVNWPEGIQLSNDGKLLFTDFGNNKIRSIDQYGKVETYAGTGNAGLINSNRLSSTFQYPGDITQDKGGVIFVADKDNHVIRKILSNGEVTTVAGTGTIGSEDGYADSSSFYYPTGVAVDSIGNIYVADQWNHKIRKIERGFKVTPSLPEGLYIDSIGRILGVPIVASPETIYTVIAENNYGSDTATFSLSVLDCEIPNFNPFSDTLSVCGDSTILSIDSGFSSYLWNTGDTTFSIVARYSGIYSISALDNNGCSSTDSLYLSIVQSDIINSDTVICKNESIVLTSKAINIGANGSGLPGSLTNRLAAYFPFNGNARDESNNGSDGSSYGATLTTDRFGNSNSAYSFDGINDYISTLNSSATDITGDMTLSLWMNPKGREPYMGNFFQTLVTKRDVGNVTYEMALYFPNTTTTYEFLSGKILPPSFQYLAYSQTLDYLNRWDHYAFVIKNDTTYLYRNGVLLQTPNGNVFPFRSQNANAGLTIGSAPGVQFFNGKLDDIIVWDRALTQTEIQQVQNIKNNIKLVWSTGDTTSSITVSPRETTTYTLTVTDGITTCTDQVTVTVSQVDTTLTSLDTTAICVGSSARLQAGLGTSYVWLNDTTVIDGASSRIYTATSAGEYRVVVTNANGCSDTSAAVTITERPLPESGSISGGGVSVCSGTNSTALSLSGAEGTIRWQSSLDSLVFTDINNATSNGYTVTNLSATTYYRVIATNSCGSDTSSVVKILVNPTPVARFSVDNASQQLRANLFVFTNISTPATGVSYYWDFDNGFFSNLKNPSYGYRTAGTYQVKLKVTTDAGCVDSTSLSVEVREAPIALNDQFSTANATLLSGNVASNDTPSPDGGNVWSLVGTNGGSLGGTASMTSAGILTYTPRLGYAGTDTLTYQVCDINGDCVQAKVSILVAAAPPPPPPPPPPAASNLYVAGITCAQFNGRTASALTRLCYTVRTTPASRRRPASTSVSAVTPTSFMYYVRVTAPSTSFTVNIGQVVDRAGFRLFKVNTGGSQASGDNCVRVASVTTPSTGQARVSITKATVGRTYIIGVRYDTKSLVGYTTTGTISPVYTFSAKIGTQTLANSTSSVTAYPNNCASAPASIISSRMPDSKDINNTTNAPAKALSITNLSLKAYPNPTSHYFNIVVEGGAQQTEGVLRVMNMVGQLIEEKKQVKPGQLIQVGHQYINGMYLIEYTQGSDRAVLKVNKH